MGNGHLRHHWDAQHGFDRAAALERLKQHPEVLPPHPEPYRAHKTRLAKERLALLGVVAAAGVVVPVVVGLALRR